MSDSATIDAARPAITRRVTRGVRRHLVDLGWQGLGEVTLPDGRRADLMAINASGTIRIIEVKSSPADLQADAKWPDYRRWCDAFFFAVPAGFDLTLLPPDCGVMLADGFDAAIRREAPIHKLPGARRRALLLLFARLAAQRLTAVELASAPPAAG